MDPYDHDAAYAVWARVTAGQDGRGGLTGRIPDMAAAAAARRSAALAAAQRVGGQAAAALRAGAQAEREAAQTLAALYFARTGERMPEASPADAADQRADTAAALRALYGRQTDAAAELARAAEAEFASRALFSRLSAEAGARSEATLRALAAILARPL